MIVRFSIDPGFENAGHFDYCVSHEGEAIFADEGLASVELCIVAATEGLGQDAVAAEIAYRGIVSGTYPLPTLALMAAQIAEHALNTTAAIEEVLPPD
jgi:hypothetical protein